jgi:nucleoside 2-deoxyribosyltransferase
MLGSDRASFFPEGPLSTGKEDTMRVYFAGPLFCEAETRFNARLTERIEALGYQVFLPQRDGVEKSKPPYDRMTPDERRRAVFELDRDQILAADVFLFVLDGRVPDEGACVELGIAYTQRFLSGEPKLLLGLQTDVRAAFIQARLNAMLSVPLDLVVQSEDDLLQALAQYKESGTIAALHSGGDQ